MKYFKDGERVVIKSRGDNGLINISAMTKWSPENDYSILINGLMIDEKRNEVVITGVHEKYRLFYDYSEEDYQEKCKETKVILSRSITGTKFNSFLDRLFRRNPITYNYSYVGWYVVESSLFTGVYPLERCVFEMEDEITEKKEVLLNE